MKPERYFLSILHFFHFFHFAFILLAFASGLQAQEDCGPDKCLPQADSCEFYRCLMKAKCCPQGYNEKIGLPFCQKFLEMEKEKFTPQGQAFLQRTRLCLQQKAAEIPTELSCKEFHKRALDVHSNCYVQNDVCSLPLADKLQLLNGIGAKAFTPSFIKETIQTLFGCANKNPADFHNGHGECPDDP